MNIDAKLKGFFKLVAIKPDGTERLLADWFPNLILTSGLNLVGTDYFLYACHVGTNNTTPVIGDTQLHAFLAGTSQIGPNGAQYSQPSAPYYETNLSNFRFPAGTATGNISEVGVGVGVLSTDPLFSRALIIDGAGSPTTITVLADEALDVYYELRLYPHLADVVGSVVINSITYTTTTRAANVVAWEYLGIPAGVRSTVSVIAADGALEDITTMPSGDTSMVNGDTAAYVNNSLYMDISGVFPLDYANFDSGISAISFSTALGRYKTGFSPSIPKDTTQNLTVNFRISWGRGS